VIESRRVRWAGRDASMGERNECRGLVKSLVKMDHLKDLVVDGKFVLKWIPEEYDTSTWPGVIRLRIGRSAELL